MQAVNLEKTRRGLPRSDTLRKIVKDRGFLWTILLSKEDLMSCPRGEASPDHHTKLRLFAASGGYCQNPGCQRELFLSTGSKLIHIAEMAHVFAATDNGPRTSMILSKAQRGAFDNLILLCSSCHTIVDKSEQDFPDSKLITWKREHTLRLTQVFGAVQQTSRQAVLAAINPLLVENYAIFEDLNPDKDYKSNPESESASAWQRNMRARIIPNNRRVLAMLDANRKLMTEQEAQVLERLRQHVHDLEARHFTSEVAGPQKRFPGGMSSMMKDY